MSDDLPTDLWIAAQRKIAAQAGIPLTVIRKGDPYRGSLLVKINLLDGRAEVLTQIRLEDELAWSPVHEDGPVPEAEADAYLACQAAFDPDLWVVEVEDRKGRLWFPGRVIRA